MSNWNDTTALITGGLGFTGSNLTRRLVDAGADVIILDIVRSADKLATVDDVRDEIDEIIDADVRDADAVAAAVERADVVYHLASQTSRPRANEHPRENLSVNCGGPLNILEAAAAQETPPQVVYASSLAVLGPVSEPIDESTVPNPIDMYGIHKRTVEDYCKLYYRLKDVPTTVVRPANLYGPRAPLYATGYGIINQFVGNALRDEPLTVFEPSDLRGFLYIDDMVEALVRVGESPQARGETYVLSTGDPRSMREAAELVVEIAGTGTVELVPWNETWSKIRRGDITTDPSKIKDELGWSTSVDLETGLRQTIEFYRENEAILKART